MSARTWFVTGASSGIGLALIQQLLARGDRVAATVRGASCTPELERLRERFGHALCIFGLDLTDGERIAPCVDQVFGSMGRIDVLASNAGAMLVGAAEEVEPAQIRRQLDTNLLGPILLIRAALPHLRRQGGGHIVQLSSEAGQTALPGTSLYSASKWGIEGFCESLALEVAGFGIAVTLVEPGRAPTRLDANADTARQWIDAYQRGAVGNLRRLVAMGRFSGRGDPQRFAQAIIAAAGSAAPPRRLVIGSDAWRNITRALRARLREVEAQQASAAAGDRDQAAQPAPEPPRRVAGPA
ncbi:SDR family oxidoreductase [Cupriavidus sp. MP-37]|uniref:SDR family oxidoreductase n=1 Tax=Cupriavidus sp. MP-37 TaxID=2884455 RepID=UPI001D09D8E2|nr:SDR family oxidoreductase [Cupriavidus sp. MP-37]UDM48875.1 SDR family oxidoreductase [Cupriavidus sp. MP-37]